MIDKNHDCKFLNGYVYINAINVHNFNVTLVVRTSALMLHPHTCRSWPLGFETHFAYFHFIFSNTNENLARLKDRTRDIMEVVATKPRQPTIVPLKCVIQFTFITI